MFNKYIINLFIFASLSAQQVEIENIRPIANVDLGNCNDIWGYTAPDGHEFALVGHRTGTYIFDVSTNPHEPIEVGFFDGPDVTHRDLKVHEHYCYSINDDAAGGIDIIDLEDPFNPILVGTYNTTFNRGHNIFIADGYAYIFGANVGAGGCRILDLADPENPVEVGAWEDRYFHDGFVKNDTLYGCDIYNGSLYIIDVSDKTNPTTMVEHNYSNYGCHSVWVTDDSKYVITGDEENGGYLYIFDIQDFDNINMVATWYPDEPEVQNKSIHNVLIKDDLLYVSYYVYGTRIVDISDPINPIEVGYYDWYPGQQGLYNGNWGTYPFTENGLIYSTDFSGNGLFVMSYPFMGEIEFEELSDTENNVDPITLSVTIDESSNYNVDYSTLMLFWGLNGTITDSTALVSSGNNYIASITPTSEDGIMHYYVSFENISGEVVTKPYGAPYATFTFNIGTDNVMPEIINVTLLSGSIQRTGTRKIQTSVQDNIGISSVNLFYSLNGINLQEIEMSLAQIDGNIKYYESNIEWNDVPIPSIISYYIECVDISQAGNTTMSSIYEFDIGYFEIVDDFEDGLDKWDTGIGWGLSEFGNDGSFSIHDSPNGNYGNDQINSLMLLQPYDFSPYTLVKLRFSHLYLTWPNQDYCNVEVSTNLIDWDIVESFTGWQGFIIDEELDLSSWVGEGYENIYIRFSIETSSDQTADGWHIDDIIFETTPSLNIDNQINIPSIITLQNTFPNPFNPITNIVFSLPKYSLVDLKIVDIKGRQVRRLLKKGFAAGRHGVSWNGTNDLGAAVGSGIYFMVLRAEGKVLSQKLSLIR